MNFTDWLNVILGVAGIGGFFFGLFQYRQAQKWKRLEFAASQIQRLTSDPDLAIALMFLEYSKRPVPLPEKYWKLAGTEVFHHDSKTLSKMLKIDYFEITPKYFIYVDSINRLLEYLDQIYQFIDIGLIEAKDVKGLIWVLERIANPTYINKEILNQYVKENTEDVVKLLALYDLRRE